MNTTKPCGTEKKHKKCPQIAIDQNILKMTVEIEKKILHENQMHEYLNFDDPLRIKDEFHFEIGSKTKGKTEIRTQNLRKGYSLCKTCIGYLKKKKMPPMCERNNLEPAEIPESLKNLTDLEKQLIVKNLIFLKIRQLPKTRMAAVNDR